FNDPFPIWEQMRHEHPIFHDTIDNRWLITRYDDAAEVFRNHAIYSAKPYSRFGDVIGQTMVQMDGKDHDIRRSIVAPIMVGKRLENDYQPLIDGVIDRLLAKLPQSGTFDAMKSITSPLPLKVIATMLGMPDSYDSYLYDVTIKVFEALAGTEPAKSLGKAKHEEFALQIDQIITERINSPRSDLITGITQGRSEDGQALSRQEIASFITLLLVAGGETTDRTLANFWYVLLKHPESLAKIRSDFSLLEPAISEFMRRDGIVVYEDRELSEDVAWYGQEIKAGEIIRVAMMSANNDETVFADPRAFDIARKDLNLGAEKRPGGRSEGIAHHMGFGLGKHFCIGYHLARAEMSSATEKLFTRYEKLAFAPGPEPDLSIRWHMRHLDHLVLSES
ncbi:MAG: cytochrome P450, partial [Actinobacteria bacterium]|nr:cytochrome P450 [Actinomycetota bacterium]